MKRVAASAWGAAVLAGAVATSACMGGGGGSAPPPSMGAPPPPPAPPPPAPPPPAPPPPNFVTAEYSAAPSLGQINVIPAYERGALGGGVLVSVIDSGIDVNNPEFAGRIDSRSADLAIPGIVSASDVRPGGPNLQDTDGHGTAVAGIVGAAKNDIGMHGVAPNANLLIFRVDAHDDPDRLIGGAIAEGVRRSAQFGAKVVNMSFGSNEDGARAGHRSLYNTTSANDIVAVVAAGNDGAADPEQSALAAVDPQARASVLIVGAVNSQNTIASFSNRAGAGAAFYLVAPGVLTTTVALGGNGSTRTFSGTSAAVPHVAGAAALLRDLWPQLSAPDVVQILLTSATDLGAPGNDPVYGWGLLNVGAAVQPLGGVSTASVSGATLDVEGSAIIMGPAFGASAPDFGDFAFLDGFGRDFYGSLNSFVRGSRDLRQSATNTLRPHESFSASSTWFGPGAAQFRLASVDTAFSEPAAAFRAGTGSEYAKLTKHRLAARYLVPVNDDMAVMVSHGFSGRELSLAAMGISSGWLARDGFSDAYLATGENTVAGAIRWRRGKNVEFDFLATHTKADASAPAHLLLPTPHASASLMQSNIRVGVSAPFGRSALRFETGLLVEPDSVMGLQASGLFGARLAGRTAYQAASFHAALSDNWGVAGRYAVGLTTVTVDGAGGLVAGADNLISTQAAFGVFGNGVLLEGDRLRFGVSQPLRIESGSLRLIVPDGYDLETRSLTHGERTVRLDSAPREINLEASYALSGFLGGAVEVSALHQLAATEDGRGGAMAVIRGRWSF